MTHFESRQTNAAAWILGLAVAFLGLCLALSAWLTSAPSARDRTPPLAVVQPPPPPHPAVEPPPRVAARPSPRLPEQATPMPPALPPPSSSSMPSDPPARPESGLALFHPGSKPLKKGIIVPDDFPLPSGFVRHYQTDDDGKQLPAILMFHPDYIPVDANDRPVAMPPDLIVPPELAPPGLPIKMLEFTPGGGSPGQGQ